MSSDSKDQDVMGINENLLIACKSALKCVALLIPFPIADQPKIVQDAINESAGYADGVMFNLSIAISEAEKLSKQEQLNEEDVDVIR